jgi:hypothetical protein
MTDQEHGPPAWGQVPSFYANVVTVAATPGIVRVTFGEAFGSAESALYRVAVAMVPQDAEIVARSILDTIEADRKARSVISPEKEKNV